MTGTPRPRNRFSAPSIVPSPPSTTARSASSPSTTSTPTFAAIAPTRATASSTLSRPCVTTATRSTDGIGDPGLELGGELGIGSVDEVEDVLMVSLRAGKPGVYDPVRLGPCSEQGLCSLADDAAADGRIAHHAARSV